MVLGGKPPRLGILFFPDVEGQVDTYVERLFEGMKPNLDESVVVVNGALNDKGYYRFGSFVDQLIVRENTGLDAWAYETALDVYGWERFVELDEFVLFDAMIMGPMHPFEEMFGEVADRDLDFWSITGFHAVDKDSDLSAEKVRIPAHIQSHFHVYRRSLVESEPSQSYWDEMPEIHDYQDSTSKHKKIFTARSEKLGFTSGLYIDTPDLEEITVYLIVSRAKKLLAGCRCPIFRRRSFFHNYEDVLFQVVGNVALDLCEYLRNETDHDTDLIWENLLRTVEFTDLMRNFQLTYVLPTGAVITEPRPSKVVPIIHVHYMELLPQMLHYTVSMPPNSDLIITVGSDEKVASVENARKDLTQKLIVCKIANRGKDVLALLVGCADLVMDYDLVYFIHDKKIAQVQSGTVGKGFALKCFENVAPGAQFVSNVLALFEKEPRLSLLFPIPPNHTGYFPISSYAWGPNLDDTKILLAEFGVKVKIHEEKGLIAPLGSTFWPRPAAMRALLEKGWAYEDFPAESFGGDGTINHAIERSRAYVAQNVGYFPAWLFSGRFVRIELMNLVFYTREFTRILALHTDLAKECDTIKWGIPNSSVWRVLRVGVRCKLPKSLLPATMAAYYAMRAMRNSTRGGEEQ